MPHSRRRVLRSLSSGLPVALLTGCSAIGEPGATPEAPERTPVDPGVIEFTAEMVDQATADHPPTVRLGVENVSDETLAIFPGKWGGYALEYIEPLEPEEGQSGTIIFHPGHPKVVVMDAEVPDEPVDGCWRFPSDAMRGYTSLRKYSSLRPGDRYAVDHDVYYLGPDDTCFPEGVYRTTVPVTPVARPTPADESDADEPRVEFETALTVSASGRFSIGVLDV